METGAPVANDAGVAEVEAAEARMGQRWQPKVCTECGTGLAVLDGWCGHCLASTQAERDHGQVLRQAGLSAERMVLSKCAECGLRPRLMEGLCDGCIGQFV